MTYYISFSSYRRLKLHDGDLCDMTLFPLCGGRDLSISISRVLVVDRVAERNLAEAHGERDWGDL